MVPSSRRRPLVPPAAAFFEKARPVAGPESLILEMGGLRIELGGLNDDLARALLARYLPYGRLGGPESNDREGLRVRLSLEDRDFFIEPPTKPEPNPVLLACDSGRIRFLGYQVAGWFDISDGRGELLLARGRYEPETRALENYIRAAVAWQAASRGGALVHAAGAVLDERGYLFYGASGAGKSTLSACNVRARVVSDDLSLVLPGEDDTLELIGSPFRGTYTGGPAVEGRFPLAAGFRLIKGESAEVITVSRQKAFAGLVANLPFVVDSLSLRPDLLESLERAFAAVPLAHLRFRKDDTYWDAIGRAGF